MFDTGPGTFASDLAAFLAAIALLTLPPLFGGLIAAALRRVEVVRRRRFLAALALALPPFALALWKIRHLDDVGFWDLLGLALGFAAGVALVMALPEGRVRRGVTGVLGGTLVGVALVEIVARVVLPAPSSVPSPSQARWSVPVTNRDASCNLMYPPLHYIEQRLSEGEPERPTVLHIGDSLVAGVGVRREETFVADLGAGQPGVRHVNLGAAGAGPEAYVVTLSRWTASPPRLAVVYVFTGNDLEDLGAPSLCCEGGPLLRSVGGRLEPRCPTPRWSIPPMRHAVTSPAPFALRVLAGSFRVADALLRLTVWSQQSIARRGWGSPIGRLPPARGREWEQLAPVLRALRTTADAHRTPLLVVALPSRATLERSLGRTPEGYDYWGDLPRGRAAQQRIVDLARAAGIDALDAWEPVRAAFEREGPALFAREYPGDVHFSALGHRVFTAWLMEALRPRDVR